MKQTKEMLFWVFTALALIVIFGRQYGGYINSFYFVSFLLPVIVGTSYMFSAFLVPKYLLQKKYFKFGLYTLYTIIVSLNLEIIVITLAFALLANYQYEHMLPAAKDIFGLAITMYFVALVKSFSVVLRISLSRQDEIATLEEKQNNLEKGYLLVRADRKNVKILLEDILYIESLSDYVKINLTDKPVIITKEKISSIEEKLTKPFLRVHRSFIVNTDKVNSFSAEVIEIASTEIPISRSYKKEVLQYLQHEHH
jgi:two-component system, LytTR family, response regulator